jgi:hypothetical protein
MADILAWLTAHGLAKFAPVFAEHEIDVEILPLLSEDDIRELGMPLGPRATMVIL